MKKIYVAYLFKPSYSRHNSCCKITYSAEEFYRSENLEELELRMKYCIIKDSLCYFKIECEYRFN